jgi:DNA (cytosine-5)-methyltransferase 1
VNRKKPTFYEFFAGAGMARAGLGDGWDCLFANDFDPLKAKTYRSNWGKGHFVEGDVWKVEPGALPGKPDLVWASSPCQDFSLAGSRAGLKGGRSSAFWGFWQHIEALKNNGRAPKIIVVENVVGLLNSHAGADFVALCAALAKADYRFGAIEVDAAHFVPQSRPRVFIIAALEPPKRLTTSTIGVLHSRAVREAFGHLPDELAAKWVWWSLTPPGLRNQNLEDVLEPDSKASWHSEQKKERLLELMSPTHQAKIAEAKSSTKRRVGTIFRRMRVEDGKKVQRAEVRFDGIAGCLRTPRGGSSRQILIVIDGETIRTRTMSTVESARLMGFENYKLPKSQIAALHVLGDGVAVPVVNWLRGQLLEPLLLGETNLEQEKTRGRARA